MNYRQFDNNQSIASIVFNGCYIMFYSAKFFITLITQYQYDVLRNYIDSIRNSMQRELNSNRNNINDDSDFDNDGGEISGKDLKLK